MRLLFVEVLFVPLSHLNFVIIVPIYKLCIEAFDKLLLSHDQCHRHYVVVTFVSVMMYMYASTAAITRHTCLHFLPMLSVPHVFFFFPQTFSSSVLKVSLFAFLITKLYQPVLKQ